VGNELFEQNSATGKLKASLATKRFGRPQQKVQHQNKNGKANTVAVTVRFYGGEESEPAVAGEGRVQTLKKALYININMKK